MKKWQKVLLVACLCFAVVGILVYVKHEYNHLMQRKVNEPIEDLSLTERFLAKVSGVEVKSRAELEKQGLIGKESSKSDELPKDADTTSLPFRQNANDFDSYFELLKQAKINNFSSSESKEGYKEWVDEHTGDKIAVICDKDGNITFINASSKSLEAFTNLCLTITTILEIPSGKSSEILAKLTSGDNIITGGISYLPLVPSDSSDAQEYLLTVTRDKDTKEEY